MSRDARSMAQTKAAKARFTGPSALSGRATASPSDSFSRNTRHESWPLPPPGRCFPARCGAAMARHGRPPSPAPAIRPLRPFGSPWVGKGAPQKSVAGPPCHPKSHGFPAGHFPRFPTISRHFPRFPGPPTPLGKGPRAVQSLLYCALWSGMGRLWRGMGGRRPPRRQQGLLGFHQPRGTQHGVSLSLQRLQGEQPQPWPTGFHETRDTNHGFSLPYPRFPTISRPPYPLGKGSARRSVAALLRVVARHGAAMARHGRPPSPAPATRPFLFTGRQIFLLERTSLHFSPRGEAKCVRGASGRGASRLARAGVLEQYVEHGKQAQRSPGARIACFDRRVVRNAG